MYIETSIFVFTATKGKLAMQNSNHGHETLNLQLIIGKCKRQTHEWQTMLTDTNRLIVNLIN